MGLKINENILKQVKPEKKWRGTVIKVWEGKAEDSGCALAVVNFDYFKGKYKKLKDYSFKIVDFHRTKILIREKDKLSLKEIEKEIENLARFCRENAVDSLAYSLPEGREPFSTDYTVFIIKYWWQEVAKGTGLNLILLADINNSRLSSFRQILPSLSIWELLHNRKEKIKDKGGKLEVFPGNNFMAGEVLTWYLVYTVGRGFGKGAILELQIPHPTNWGMPQVVNPEGENYISVRSIPCRDLAVCCERTGGFCGWRVSIEVVEKRVLQAGDKIIVIMGDRTSGSPGNVVQTNVSEKRILRVGGDLEDAKVFKGEKYGEHPRIEGSPELIIKENNPQKIRIISPSVVRKGKEFDLIFRVDDAFGNMVRNFEGEIKVVSPKNLLNRKIILKKRDNGCKKVKAQLNKCGLYYFEAIFTNTSIGGRSNPVLCLEELPVHKLYWGDIHIHSELSDGTGSPDHAYWYAREANGLDIAALADHDYMGTYWGRELRDSWDMVRRKAEQYYQPGKFVTLVGYEFSGGCSVGGHQNIYYFEKEDEIYPHILYKSDGKGGFKQTTEGTISEIKELYRRLKGKKVVVIPHCVSECPARWKHIDPDLTPVAEIYSVHGISEAYPNSRPLHEYAKDYNTYGAPTCYLEALKKGLRLGCIGGTDGHDGFPGFSYSWGPFRGGIMGVYMKELSRESLWEALWSRHVYATTGERIIVIFAANGHMMGEEFLVEEEFTLNLKVYGTDMLRKVELIKNGKTYKVFYPGNIKAEIELKEKPDEKRTFYYFRITQVDGEMAWTSPVWIICSRLKQAGERL